MKFHQLRLFWETDKMSDRMITEFRALGRIFICRSSTFCYVQFQCFHLHINIFKPDHQWKFPLIWEKSRRKEVLFRPTYPENPIPTSPPVISTAPFYQHASYLVDLRRLPVKLHIIRGVALGDLGCKKGCGLNLNFELIWTYELNLKFELTNLTWAK